MNPDIKPCPFCGSADVETVVLGGTSAHVACRTCGARGPEIRILNDRSKGPDEWDQGIDQACRQATDRWHDGQATGWRRAYSEQMARAIRLGDQLTHVDNAARRHGWTEDMNETSWDWMDRLLQEKVSNNLNVAKE